jgi:hypothetical protein
VAALQHYRNELRSMLKTPGQLDKLEVLMDCLDPLVQKLQAASTSDVDFDGKELEEDLDDVGDVALGAGLKPFAS